MKGRQKIIEEFGVKACCPIKSINTQVTQENIHRLMKFLVHSDGYNENNIQQ